jgi:hypothetical protein
MKKSQSLKKCEKKLSIRERLTIKGVIDGMPMSRAMLEAGYSPATAHGKCSEKYKELQPTIQILMDKKGITDDLLLDVLMDGLKATKPIII